MQGAAVERATRRAGTRSLQGSQEAKILPRAALRSPRLRPEQRGRQTRPAVGRFAHQGARIQGLMDGACLFRPAEGPAWAAGDQAR